MFLNEVYSIYNTESIKEIQSNFFNLNQMKIYTACKHVLTTLYCKALELMESFFNDRTQYFIKRLNTLIVNVKFELVLMFIFFKRL
jgi:hypothetical protein